MPTTSSEFTVVQSWIGQNETQVVFDERFDRLLPGYDDRADAINAAIEESLRAQLAHLTLDQPSAMAVEGINISYVTNITTLRENLKSFMASKGSATAGAVPLYRQPSR